MKKPWETILGRVQNSNRKEFNVTNLDPYKFGTIMCREGLKQLLIHNL